MSTHQPPDPTTTDTADDTPTRLPGPTSVAAELAAMRRISRELDRLDLDTRGRVAGWLAGRYCPTDVIV